MRAADKKKVDEKTEKKKRKKSERKRSEVKGGMSKICFISCDVHNLGCLGKRCAFFPFFGLKVLHSGTTRFGTFAEHQQVCYTTLYTAFCALQKCLY